MCVYKAKAVNRLTAEQSLPNVHLDECFTGYIRTAYTYNENTLCESFQLFVTSASACKDPVAYLTLTSLSSSPWR